MSCRSRYLGVGLVLALGATMPALATVNSTFSAGTLTIGSDGADGIAVTCSGVGGNVLVNGANPGTGAVACSALTGLIINGGPGANLIDITTMSASNFAALTSRTVDGAAGMDTILGSPAVDIMLGGADNDTIDGNNGADVAFGGSGSDVFRWDPGDGSDVLEGQADIDTLVFAGSATTENFALVANGGRLLMTRDIASIVMDVDDVEQLELSLLGGSDTLVVNDLAPTDLDLVLVHLAGTLGGASGDTASDTVTIVGGGGADSITASTAANTISVSHGPVGITIDTFEPTLDNLSLAGGDGGDTLTIDASLAGQIATLSVDGGIGIDTVVARGTAAADQLLAAASTPFVSVAGVALVDVLTTETLRLDGLGNDDTFSATGNLAALFTLTIDAGDGNDTILAGNGADLLLGGAGNDFIDGNQGADVVLAGSGNDVFQWDPGDGNDVVEGQSDLDTLLFNGSAGMENFALSPNGGRLLLTRNLGSIVMDIDDVEQVEINAFGSIDNIVVNELAATDVDQIALHLAGTLGGSTGDGMGDTVSIVGGAGVDRIVAGTAGGALSLSHGLIGITIDTFEPTLDNLSLAGGDGADTLTIDASLAGQVATLSADGGAASDTVIARGSGGADQLLAASSTPFVSVAGVALVDVLSTENLRLEGFGGDDTFSTVGNIAPLFALTIDAGDGNDSILGGNGADVLLGGAGSDFLDGNQGADIAFGGAGNDAFQWDPGDGNDVIEGQSDLDTLVFSGSAGTEDFALSPNGGRLLLTRNLGSIVMDIDDVEQIDVHALGSIDNLVVNDLAATDATRVRALLAGTLGGAVGDSQADTVTINAGAGADAVSTSASAGVVNVVRGALRVEVRVAEPALDRLVVNGLGGDDTLTATTAPAQLLALTLDGGGGSAMPGDVVSLTGDAVAENYTIAPGAPGVAVTRTVPSGFTLGVANAEWLQLATGDAADTVATQGLATTSQILDGGAPSVSPGDTLSVAGFSGDVSISPILVAGAAPIVHTGFEQSTNQQVIEAFLTGAQETPPNPSTGRGYGTVTFNAAQDAILVTLEYTGLLGNNTQVHLHGPAPRRVAASPVIDLPVSGTSNGSFAVGPFPITPTQRSEIKAGRWYFNVHSTAPGSSGGEIRGQVDNLMFRDGFE
jgi:Ca2+-binding RTX toxin-like protein